MLRGLDIDISLIHALSWSESIPLPENPLSMTLPPWPLRASFYSPNSACTIGVLAALRLVEGSSGFRASETVQNVAKTIGFTTFTKKKLLWLENGGPPITLAAATAHLFSPTLIKPMKYQHFFWQITILLIKPMKYQHLAKINQKINVKIKFLKKV